MVLPERLEVVVEPQDVGLLLLLNNLEPRMVKVPRDDVISGKHLHLPVQGQWLQSCVRIGQIFVFTARLKIQNGGCS